MPDFGIMRGFNEKLFGDKLVAGQLPTQLGLIGSTNFGFDSDAQAFFDRVSAAGGSLSATEKTAVNTLVIQMKADGTWTLMKAIYPMVGASAAACAQNLKSSSFTGTFTSGWTFASTGVTGNGTSAYMDTNLNPNVQMGFNSQSFFIYKTTIQVALACEWGANDSGANGSAMFLNGGYNAMNEYGAANTFTSTTVAGAYILSRNNENFKKLFQNGALYASIASTATNYTIPTLYLGCRRQDASTDFFSNTQTRFLSIGDGLTNTQASNFYTAVQAFQTTLSRQV